MKNKMLQELGIDKKVIDFTSNIENEIKDVLLKYDDIGSYNQLKVLNDMQKNTLSNMHFSWNTGYGYDDPGREKIEAIYADVFKTENAIVRPIIVNGTHALILCLTGILRPGDELLSISGKPYDTLDEVIGISNTYRSSLMEIGVKYNQMTGKSDTEFRWQKYFLDIT